MREEGGNRLLNAITVSCDGIGSGGKRLVPDYVNPRIWTWATVASAMAMVIEIHDME